MILATRITNNEMLESEAVMCAAAITTAFGYLSLGKWSHEAYSCCYLIKRIPDALQVG